MAPFFPTIIFPSDVFRNDIKDPPTVFSDPMSGTLFLSSMNKAVGSKWFRTSCFNLDGLLIRDSRVPLGRAWKKASLLGTNKVNSPLVAEI